MEKSVNRNLWVIYPVLRVVMLEICTFDSANLVAFVEWDTL